MAGKTYDRLTFLDNSFLLMEGPNSPMHIAGTAHFEASPLRTPDGGIDIDTIRAYVGSRLHLIPRYRQRIAYIPLENHPVWIDDDHFNIHYHVRHTALPKPGDERQLKRLAGRIMSQHLDRSKPLWELWFVEGLQGGDRIAMISKVHHCMIDGLSSVDLLNVILSPVPSAEFEQAPDWIPRPAPTTYELVRDAAVRYATLPYTIARSLPQALQDAGDPRSDLRARARALRDSLGSGLRNVSATPLNQPIGGHRRFDWLAMSLDDVKHVKNQLGGSINDVVLSTVAGAVRRFLERRRISCETLDFSVMAPVSVRTAEERGALGNRVSAWMVPMPLREHNPKRRLELIRETTARLKESKQALGAEVLTQVGEWTPSTLLSLGARMATRLLPFNLVVTNVPGPQIPLYMLGARMYDNYGLVPLTDYLCLGIVLFSYAGKLCWGFTGEWDLLPDLHELVIDVEKSFQELMAAASPVVAAQPTTPGRPRRRAGVSRRAGTTRRAAHPARG